jgi:hypothetical protein
VLGEVADGSEAEALQARGDLRPDTGQRLDRRVGVRTAPSPGKTGLLAGEAGRRSDYGSPSQ